MQKYSNFPLSLSSAVSDNLQVRTIICFWHIAEYRYKRSNWARDGRGFAPPRGDWPSWRLRVADSLRNGQSDGVPPIVAGNVQGACGSSFRTTYGFSARLRVSFE